MKKRELATLIDTLAVRLARLEDDVRALQWKVASLLPPDARPPWSIPPVDSWVSDKTGQAPDKARPSTVSSGQTLSETPAVQGQLEMDLQRSVRGQQAGSGQADGVDISSSAIEINRYDLYP